MKNTLSSNWIITPENRAKINQILTNGKKNTITKAVPFGAFLEKPNKIGWDIFTHNKSGYSQKGQGAKEGLKC